MDARHFDTLARALAECRSRRGLLGLLAGLGAALGLGALDSPDGAAKRKRPGRRRSHRPGKGKDSRKGKRKGKHKGKGKGSCLAHSDCGAGSLCLEDGACQPCTVTCNDTPEACGAALQTALEAGGTVYVCPGTYQGGFVIEAAVSVNGAGDGDDPASNTILDGHDAVRVVQIEPETGTVELAQVRISGGTDLADGGGGVRHLGTTLRMTECTVTGSEGSGIFADSDTTLELTRCTLSDNTSGGGGGAINSNPLATLTLTDCLIEGNSAPFGAGIAINGPTTLAGSTEVRGNTANIVGGGILVVGDDPLTIAETCRVTGNKAGSGGGIYTQSFTVTVTLEGGADPSPIVVANCPNNCAGSSTVPTCAPAGTCPS